MYRLFISLIVLSCLTVTSGCTLSQTAKDSWKYTKRQYYSYINTPAQVDLDDKGSASDYQMALGEYVFGIDQRLSALARRMENSDLHPDQEWVMSMMGEFPWLSGIALTGPDGGVEARYPEHLMKEFDVKPLLEEDPKQNLIELRTYVQSTPLGPEVYIGKPVYHDGIFRGLVVSHFDPSTLVQAVGGHNADKIMLLSSFGPLYVGNNASSAALSSEEWDKILKDNSSGYIGSGGSEYFWVTRYIGNTPVVYAISTSIQPVPFAEMTDGSSAAPSPEQGSGFVPVANQKEGVVITSEQKHDDAVLQRKIEERDGEFNE